MRPKPQFVGAQLRPIASHCRRSTHAGLLFLRADPADLFDLERRPAGLFGDFAILFGNERARGLVAVQPAKKLGRHTAVGTLGAVFIDDVEKGEFAFGIGPGLFRHGSLSSIKRPLSKQNWRRVVARSVGAQMTVPRSPDTARAALAVR